jgi:hypothetical protein
MVWAYGVGCVYTTTAPHHRRIPSSEPHAAPRSLSPALQAAVRLRLR